MIAELSPQLVRQYLLAEHLLRSRTFPEKTVKEIFRFGAPVGHAIELHKEASRCMELARQAIAHCEECGDSFNSGSAIFAGQLTGSKGRFQRHWHAPEGGSWMVLTMVNTLLPRYAALLPLAAGVAVCETVRQFGVPGKLKWVNDVLVEGRKVAGILCETLVGPNSSEEYILVGIGLNVNNKSFPEELNGLADSMSVILGEDLNVAQVAATMLAKLSWNIGLLYYQEEVELSGVMGPLESKGHSPTLEAWTSLSDTIGRKVSYGFNVVTSPQYSAKVLDVNSAGALVMELSDGSVVQEAGGEILYID